MPCTQNAKHTYVDRLNCQYLEQNFWAAVLVFWLATCTRINGRPRQRLVKYLGCISKDVANDPSHTLAQARFWLSVSRALNDVKLPENDRQRFLRSKELVVKPIGSQWPSCFGVDTNLVSDRVDSG